MNRTSPAAAQRGSTLIGFIAGLVTGLLIAVVVAVYITNAPVPFLNKVQRPTENVKPGADGKLPDPNRPLNANVPPPEIDAGKGAAVPTPAAAAKGTTAAPPGATTEAKATDDSRFMLQAGAFKTPTEADGMRARLALIGLDAKVYPVEQAGATLYRVRVGPYSQRAELEKVRRQVADAGIESQIVPLR